VLATPERQQKKTGLVLSGGGARGAYQVGVLKAISELYPKQAANPFSIISGTSAGALNAVALASSANNFRLGVKKVERIWSNLSVEQVVKSGHRDIAMNAFRFFISLFNSGVGAGRSVSLLDNEPLGELLQSVIRFDNLQKRIDAGLLDAVSVTTTSYVTGSSVSFFQGKEELTRWHRTKRIGIRDKIGVEHLMASAAIPGVFPAVKIGKEYFGDGSMRQLAPLSTALRLGAERIVVIGVRGHNREPVEPKRNHSPSVAQIVGHVFSSAFIDSLESDLENLQRVNELVGMAQNEAPGAMDNSIYKPVDVLVIRPSIDFDKIAREHLGDLPKGLRRGLSAIGATKGGGGNLASYLLFHANYCQELVKHGYNDAIEQSDTIEQFFMGSKGFSPDTTEGGGILSRMRLGS